MTFVLHYTPIGNERPDVEVLVLHGILGSGRNLRTFAQRLAIEVPAARFWLVDLRNHGDSIGALPPHTLDACADDLDALCTHLSLSPDAVIGHSFGGKVALHWLRREPPGLAQVWVLDTALNLPSDPDDGPDSVERVIAALADIAQPLATRQDVVAQMTARGFSLAIGQWMTTNLRQAADGLRWRFDLDAVGQMLASYVATDVWPVLELPPVGSRVDIVRAERSQRWPTHVLERLAVLAGRGVHTHLLADSGHWVHVDQPAALVALIAPSLQRLVG